LIFIRRLGRQLLVKRVHVHGKTPL
jgi:hypothetical protein